MGKDRQVFITVFFLLITASSGGQAGRSFKYLYGDSLQVTSIVSEATSISINYNIPEVDIEKIVNENGSFYRLSIPGHSPSSGPGKPERPVFSRLISIPPGAGYKLKISDVKSTVINPRKDKIDGILYPAQESQIKDGSQQKKPFLIDKPAYASAGLISSDTVIIEYLGRSGSTSLATLYIYPVRYNPRLNQVEVIKSMKIEISFTGSSGKATKSILNESVVVNKSPDKGMLNYNPADVVPGYSEQPVKMVILTDTIFKKQLEPFFRWKTQKGFKLKILYRGTGLAGNNYAQLKDTLTKIYNSSSADDPPPQYLLIIGDVNKIPTFSTAGGTGNSTDLYYGEFNGNGDYIPEMFIGRLPVSDTAELRSVVRKIIQYEKFEFAGSDIFLSRALVTAGNDTNFINYMNGQVKYAVTNYLTKENKINEFHFSYPASSIVTVIDSIKKVIDGGVSFINYSGHGSSDGWLYTTNGTSFYLKYSDVAKLSNKNMYPFVISNACRTGQFNNPNSLSNKMVLADGKGALGFIGCSNDSYWDEDYYWAVGPGTPTITPSYSPTALGAYDRLFHTHDEPASDWYYTMGQINYSGNMSVSASPSTRKQYYWETYNLVGDPSLIPIIGQPDSFHISLPDSLPNGLKSLTLKIDPLAYIAVSHFDTLWDASYSSPSGSVTLSMPGVSDDSCLIVITGQKKIPLIKKVYFSRFRKEFINLSPVEINDIAGNNNKKADFGETFFLKLAVRNLGQTDANDLYAKISSESQAINIKSDSVWIGKLAAGSETVLTEGLAMTVTGNIKDLSSVTIDLVLKDRLTEKHYPVDIVIHAPDIHIISCLIDDSYPGNGNHIADPGETFTLVFSVSNQGSSNISGQLRIVSKEEGIKFTDPDIKSGMLEFGDTTEIRTEVKISETVQSGSYISVISTIDCSPFNDRKEFTFRVGKVRESFETSSFNVFPWINLSAFPWIITPSGSFDGRFSARSGTISHNGKTSLIIKTLSPAPDSVQFYYKVSSESGYDFLSFLVNDKEVLKKSGEIDWTKAVVPVQPGLNKLEWFYKKDNSVSAGSDCAWIDMIDFTGTGSLTYIEKDLQLAKIASPVLVEKFGDETVTVKVLNIGKDTIDGFNLAYILNNNQPVFQYFNNQVIPYGDTVNVSFKTRADLSKYGFYSITAYAFDNSDDYHMNDTLKLNIENTDISRSFTLYPNPFINEFTVYIDSHILEKIEISIFNLSGQKMYESKATIVAGKNEIKISDTRISPALYYLNIRGQSFNKTIPVLKVSQ